MIAGKFSRNNADDIPKLHENGEATRNLFESQKKKKERKAVDDGKHATDASAMRQEIMRIESLSMHDLRAELTEAEQLELRRVELFDLWLMYGGPYTQRAMEGFLKAEPIEDSVYEKTEFAGPLMSIMMFTKRAFNQLLRTPGDMFADVSACFASPHRCLSNPTAFSPRLLESFMTYLIITYYRFSS